MSNEAVMARYPSGTDRQIADTAPTSAQVTDYDRSMASIYLRLLDAEAAGADWRDVTRIVLQVDPEKEPARAERMHQTHLARAQWMTTHGYRQLLRH